MLMLQRKSYVNNCPASPTERHVTTSTLVYTDITETHMLTLHKGLYCSLRLMVLYLKDRRVHRLLGTTIQQLVKQYNS